MPINPEGVLIIEVTPPSGETRVLDPIGAPGDAGWSPVLAVKTRVSPDDQRVLQVIDWQGGTGAKPGTGRYVGATGLVVDIADAIGIRGNGADGSDGANGADGATIHLGSGVPGAGLGNIGDLFIDLGTFTLYAKTGVSTWASQGVIKGDPGTDGTNGTNGTDGTDGVDGATILVGSGGPSNGIGNDDDLYIDTTSTNRDLYHKSAGSWGSPAATLRGPQGDQGIQGIQGIKGDQGDQGIQGIQGIPGTDGADGSDGTDGTSLIFGTVDPTGAVGADGDSFIQVTSQHLWTRSAGSWTDRGSIKGDQGIQGIQGIQGVQGDPGVDAINAADMLIFLPGKQQTAAQLMVRLNVVRAFTWPASLTGSVCNAKTAATGSTAFTIKNNGSTIGTITYGASSASGTISFSSQVTFAANDVIEIFGPGSIDSTLADMSWSFLGHR